MRRDTIGPGRYTRAMMKFRGRACGPQGFGSGRGAWFTRAVGLGQTARTMARLAAAVVALGAGAAGTGCTGLEPAAIGAGASAAESGVTFFTRGKARSFEPVLFTDAVAAVRAAVERLKFAADAGEFEFTDERGDLVAEESPAARRARMVYTDELDESIVVVVARRTEHVTMIQTDVGTFGLTGLAAALTAQIKEELRRMEAYRRVQPASQGDQ